MKERAELASKRDEIRTLYLAGVSTLRIAEMFGASKPGVAYHLDGLPRQVDRAPEWMCVCGPREDFDGLECRRCRRRSERAMREYAESMGRPWPPESVTPSRDDRPNTDATKEPV